MIRHVFLDTEFIPSDPTLKGFVSIGLCDQDGREYYAVHRDFSLKVFKRSAWLMANVWPSLPKPHGDIRLHGKWPRLDTRHPSVKTAPQIAEDVADFFADTDATETRLWAWYGAQDMCRLYSLWGNDWAAMPDQIPQWFCELEQLRDQVGRPELPEQVLGVHNALADARHNRIVHGFLEGLVAP